MDEGEQSVVVPKGCETASDREVGVVGGGQNQSCGDTAGVSFRVFEVWSFYCPLQKE